LGADLKRAAISRPATQALGTPIILVDGVSPESIAVSGSAVFFINQTATGYQVVKAATDSPTTSVIASYSKFTSSIVADANSVYWTVPYTIYDDKLNGGVWTRAVTGGTPRRIAEWYVRSTCVQALFATGDGESNVFHAQFRSSIYRTFMAPASAFGWITRPLIPASSSLRPRTLTVDASHVLFAEDDGDVFVVPRSGGAPLLLGTGSSASDTVAQTLVASTGTFAYFSSATTIFKVPIGGGAATSFATVSEAPAAMAIDGGFLYWACRGCGEVLRKPLSGFGITTVATGENAPHSLAFDASNIYFGTAVSLKRVAK